jgi:hypothetical protein
MQTKRNLWRKWREQFFEKTARAKRFFVPLAVFAQNKDVHLAAKTAT